MLKELICKWCKEIYKAQTFEHRPSVYCSRKCSFEGFKKETFYKNCATCLKEFSYKAWELNKGYPRKFCSRKCFRCPEPTTKGIAGKRNFWKYATYQQKLEYIRPIFEDKVIKKEGCWGWKPKIFPPGYATIYYDGRIRGAHCISWMLHHGKIPVGLFICHKCDNPQCTNPDHLFLGTPKDNMHDMILKGRRVTPKGENHCHSKLNNEKVKKIKQLLKDGLSCQVIGSMFQVSRQAISGIKFNKTWKDI